MRDVETGITMIDLTPLIEQGRAFLELHAPPNVLHNAVPVALAFLAAGIGLSVLGAKLAKPAMTALLGIIGCVGGVYFARDAGYPAPLGALIGAAMLATVAHLTFRLWVGVATAIVLASVAMGTFGYDKVAPHAPAFNSVVAWTPTAGAATFSVPTPEEQQAYVERTPTEWARQFWAYVKEKDSSVDRQGRLLGIGSLVTGLFLGVVLVRWMLILSTSLAGTGLVTTGILTLFAHFMSQPYQALQSNPAVIGMAVGGFFVTSLIVQTLVTRKPPSRSKETAKS